MAALDKLGPRTPFTAGGEGPAAYVIALWQRLTGKLDMTGVPVLDPGTATPAEIAAAFNALRARLDR